MALSQKVRSPFSRAQKESRQKLKSIVKQLNRDWDLSEYKTFFPVARELKRKHLFFAGPTNSGKSYRGFNELAQFESGTYLAPLRMLALEGQEEIEKRGKVCSLLTGEESDFKESAQFVASTTEMAQFEKEVDCALIDEVQLILDKGRGWAWTQVIVGMPAKKLIMTGSEECIPTLRALIEEYLEEELEVVHLKRIGNLEVLDQSVNLTHLGPYSAVIAFSRREVLSIKKTLEDAGKKVSVLYGNLSPGVRREEARRFRSGETEILVATDCIGMGLNLPIQTLIFSETSKFDGREMRSLEVSEIKQIAGRAGRFGLHECGYVGVVLGDHPKMIADALKSPQHQGRKVCFVRPTLSQLEALSDRIGNQSVRDAFALFGKLNPARSHLVCADLNEILNIATKIESNSALASLSFAEKYLFTCAPVSSENTVSSQFIRWLSSYAKQVPILLDEQEFAHYVQNASTLDDLELNGAENKVKILTLYYWLARKKPAHFPSVEVCNNLRTTINSFIENSLKRKGLFKRCTNCSKKLSLHYVYKICESCFSARRESYDYFD